MTNMDNVKDFLDELIRLVDEGECFIDEETHQDLIITIDLFKASCKDAFEENK